MWNLDKAVFLTLLSSAICAGALLQQSEIDELCVDQEFNRVAVPSDCSSFIQCVYGRGTQYQCLDKTYCFDAATQKCVKDDACPCKFQDTANDICNKVSDSLGMIFPATDCSQFYICLGPVAYLITCSNGLLYSHSKQNCVELENTSCQPMKDMCDEKLMGHKFAASKCSQYYECNANKVLSLSDCGANEYFDIDTSKCIRDMNGDCCSQSKTHRASRIFINSASNSNNA